MATMPYATFSTGRLMNIGRRLGRTCAKFGNGAQKFSDSLTTPMDDLDQKRKDAEAMGFEADAAYDAAIQSDRALNDAIRTTYEKCAQYERDNHFVPVLEKAFPDGGISSIVYSARDKGLEKARQIVNRIRELATDDRLNAIAADLESVLNLAVKAQEDLAAKKQAHDDARTKESLARERFVEQYSSVYHDACSEMGQRRANAVFPSIIQRKTKAPTPAPVAPVAVETK